MVRENCGSYFVLDPQYRPFPISRRRQPRVDNSATPPEAQPGFQTGAVITHPGAMVALGADHFDLVFQVVAHHRQHAEPYEHGWLSGVHYRGRQLAVATVRALKETHLFPASEARALGQEIRARPHGKLLAQLAQCPEGADS